MPLRNTAHGYGAVTKCLHWSVYLLFLYQYLGANLMTRIGRDATVLGMGLSWWWGCRSDGPRL